jgi:hypothetical protein
MHFEKHLFISYSHIDNESQSPEQKGWVTRFHTSLGAFVSMRLGEKAEIWRDDKLGGSDIFAKEILDQFPRTALLLSVVTPRYVRSEWCTREVNAFCEAARLTGGIVVDNKARIIKVIKTPVDDEAPLPSAMKETLGYPFYVLDEGHAPLELDAAYGDEIAQTYNRKVAALAYQIAQLLKKMEAYGMPSGEPAAGQASFKPTVYLAECSHDRRENREMLETELKFHGYPVLPDQKMSSEEAAYVGEVEALLARSQLSIHLVGKRYGAVPDGPSEKSAVALQNELAAKRCQDSGLRRVIWLPEGTRSEQPQQQALIESLLRDAEAQLGADLVTGDLESLKGAIHAALKKLEDSNKRATQTAQPATGDKKLILLICNEPDRKSVLPLFRHLKEQAFDVKLPAFTGDAAEIRQTNQECMSHCDAIILFYGSGDEAWKLHQQNEIKKMQGVRGIKPLLANHTYLAEPVTPDKEFLVEVGGPELINGLKGFSAADMSTFIRCVNPDK